MNLGEAPVEAQDQSCFEGSSPSSVGSTSEALQATDSDTEFLIFSLPIFSLTFRILHLYVYYQYVMSVFRRKSTARWKDRSLRPQRRLSFGTAYDTSAKVETRFALQRLWLNRYARYSIILLYANKRILTLYVIFDIRPLWKP